MLLLVSVAEMASAQEILGWWKRGLLPVELREGDWARYETYEFSEGSAYTDTLEIAVLATREDGTHWISLTATSGEGRTLLLVDPEHLGPDQELLDAVVRAVRESADGRLAEEDIESRRDDRLVQRHFEDPFQDPEITRTELPDSTVTGLVLRRERVRLEETLREETPLGSRRMVIETRLDSWAELSADLPVFGVWALGSRTMISTSTEGRGGGRPSAPLLTETRLRCLEFGRAADFALPGPLRD